MNLLRLLITHNLKWKHTYRHCLYLLMGGCFLFACNPTKFIANGDYLLDKASVEVDTKSVTSSDLEHYMKQKPNLRILKVVRFHLGVYNMSTPEDTSGFNKWLRKIGEAPVVFDKSLEDASVANMKKYMETRGYFDAEVVAKETRKREKRVSVKYVVTANKPFRISKYTMKIDNDTVNMLVRKDSAHTVIKKGEELDVDKHEAERTRVLDVMKNNGYYDFAKKDIGFVIDTFYNTHTAKDTLVINKNKIFGFADANRNKYQRYFIDKVRVYTDFNGQQTIGGDRSYFNALDSVVQGNYIFYYKNHLNVTTTTWLNRIFIVPQTLYNASLVEKTRFLLSDLKLVRYVNITFAKTDKGKLDCTIFITQSKSQNYTVDLEGTNSSGNYGGAIGLTYQHKNIFGGAQFFSSKIKLARENQTGSSEGMKSVYSDELGITNQLQFPEFILPIWGAKLKKKIKASTVFDLDYNYQKRPDYSRTIFTGSYGYRWKKSEAWTHHFNLMDLNYVNMHYVSPDFQALIDSSYLYYSYRDHMIAATNYTVIYNNQNMKGFKNSKYMRLGIETAGNLLHGINSLLNSNKVDGSYEIAGIPYSQYVKLDAEFAYNKYIDESNNIVYRVAAGVGVPYGNATVMPFERRYFAGGANSLRGWQVRSLGPGTFRQDNTDYYNQTGDIRLESNVEYRFKMVGIFEGALFADAGNVWTIRDYAEQPGGVFKFDQFYKQIALSSGAGLRLNLSFVVLRFDMGMKMYDPSQDRSLRWRCSRLNFADDFTFHFAIGYPF